MSELNFDHWSNLAATNPAEFEKQKKAALMALVDKAPASQKPSLEALVTSLCAPTTGTTMEKVVHAQNMMMESLVQLQDALTELAVESQVSEGSANFARYTRMGVKKQ